MKKILKIIIHYISQLVKKQRMEFEQNSSKKKIQNKNSFFTLKFLEVKKEF